MRIVHSFNASSLKITLFHYQSKYSLKVQDAGYEIVFNLGDLNVPGIGEQLEFYFQNPTIIAHYKSMIQKIHEGKLDILSEIIVDHSGLDEII